MNKQVKNSIFIALFSLQFLFFAVSCKDNGIIYEQTKDIDNGKWKVADVYSCGFKIEDISQNYDISYIIRNSSKYAFYNLYVTYYLEDDKGKIISSSLQNLQLLDAGTGEPFGSGLGDLYEHEITALAKFKFPQKGNYKFKVKQYMRQDPINEIFTVGARVKKNL